MVVYLNTLWFWMFVWQFLLFIFQWNNPAIFGEEIEHHQSGPQPDLDIWWRHLHLQKWRPRRETRVKVTSWLFAGPRSVLTPYYFESCDFRQWEIRGVKKKCRPMNVCAFLGSTTTEHESFSAQRNARQGVKHRKKRRWVSFFGPLENIFWNLHKICLLIVVCLV